MKPAVAFLTLAALSGCSPHEDHDMYAQHQHSTPAYVGDHDAHSHQTVGGEAELIVLKEPMRASAGERVDLELMIHAADGRMVKDFDVVHEQKIHLIVVRDDLEHLAHLHPTVDLKGNIRTMHTFAAGGSYRLYAEFKPRGGAASVATTTIKIRGEVGSSSPLIPNAPGRIVNGSLIADVATAPVSGDWTRIVFDLRDDSDRPITDLQPWMGELGHLLILSADGTGLVHSHVERSESRGSRIAFTAQFPSAGVYKGWGQFNRHGQVKTLPFVIRAGE